MARSTRPVTRRSGVLCFRETLPVTARSVSRPTRRMESTVSMEFARLATIGPELCSASDALAAPPCAALISRFGIRSCAFQDCGSSAGPSTCSCPSAHPLSWSVIPDWAGEIHARNCASSVRENAIVAEPGLSPSNFHSPSPLMLDPAKFDSTCARKTWFCELAVRCVSPSACPATCKECAVTSACRSASRSSGAPAFAAAMSSIAMGRHLDHAGGVRRARDERLRSSRAAYRYC